MVSFFGSASVLLLTLCLDAYSLPAYILPVQKFALQPFPLTNARLNRPNLRNNGHMAPRKIETQLDFDASMTTALEAGIAIGGSYLLLQLGAYWRMQFVTAGIISGIPAASSIVELDAKDGKTVFYLPKKAFYTAVMSQGDSKDPLVIKEKKRFNEQLILECIGKANSMENLGLQGNVRARTQDVAAKSIDCVLSVGALDRIGRQAQAALVGTSHARYPSMVNQRSAKLETIKEAYRILKPGGLFVFVEPDGGQDNVIELMQKIFPETIGGPPTDAASARSKGRRRRERQYIQDSSSYGAKSRSSEDAYRNTSRVKTSRNEGDDGNSDGGDGDDQILDIGASASVEQQQPGDNGQESDGARQKLESEKQRPALTYSRLSNVLFPFVTGIAVRP